MSDDKKTRTAVFSRQYDDEAGNVTVTHGDEGEEVGKIELSKIEGMSEVSLPAVVKAGILRFFAGGVVNAATAALKADGGTIDSAIEKAGEYIKEVYNNSLKFRSGDGESSLSDAQEQEIVARVMVELGQIADPVKSAEWVKGAYATTVEKVRKNKDGTTKTYNARPLVMKIRNIDAVKKALLDASPKSKIDQFAGLNLPT